MALDANEINSPRYTTKKVVLKTIQAKVEEINHSLEELKKNLGYFEKKYGMSSQTFYQNFVQGSLSDEIDFFEWKATKDIFDELRIEKEALLEVLK
ncbi:hypothetical protein SDD30_12815 [Moorella naiadis]|uniref:hypothetical protein n=1 Tax=Moorella naiadis (nom. illeg.) TaxID=3093670 RepID=UPI003D9CA2AC